MTYLYNKNKLVTPLTLRAMTGKSNIFVKLYRFYIFKTSQLY